MQWYRLVIVKIEKIKFFSDFKICLARELHSVLFAALDQGTQRGYNNVVDWERQTFYITPTVEYNSHLRISTIMEIIWGRRVFVILVTSYCNIKPSYNYFMQTARIARIVPPPECYRV